MSKKTANIKSVLFGKRRIQQQLYLIYFAAVIVPIALIGTFLLTNTSRLLTNYYRDLLESDNLRVKTILFEITTQIYNISEEISFDDSVREVLSSNYYFSANFMEDISQLSVLDNYIFNYAEIDAIDIYTDNPGFEDYKQFHKADAEVLASEWFQTASNQASIVWWPIESQDERGNTYWNLGLIRRIPLTDTHYNAVLVIKISDNYLKTRLLSTEYETMISVDQGAIFFSSDQAFYGQPQVVDIDYEETYFQQAGTSVIDNVRYFVDVSTMQMYQSGARVYICTMNEDAYYNIRNIILICLCIILLAVVIPGMIIRFFTQYFSSRVMALRFAMHEASNENYEIENSVKGQDEISEAFSDLEVMVQKIKKKDADMYEAQINEKELINEQQVMEFKMLASQINPHFLYNTLETIRMKAFTAGDKEVATAIKLLGKSMRYVLENTGTSFTTVKGELEHVENYLAIQKLRFGDKFTSEFVVEDGIDTEKLDILPLLLQPVVENALLHGLEETEEDGRITISLYREEDLLCIAVSDNGSGMEEEQLSELRKDIEVKDKSRNKSIGLYNINQRMKLNYGPEYGLKIYSSPAEGTCVTLKIPLHKMVYHT